MTPKAGAPASHLTGFLSAKTPSDLFGEPLASGEAFLSVGVLVAWGRRDYETAVPAGLTNVVTIAAGAEHSLALLSDGTVAAWGYNGWGQTTVPASLANVVAIGTGGRTPLS